MQSTCPACGHPFEVPNPYPPQPLNAPREKFPPSLSRSTSTVKRASQENSPSASPVKSKIIIASLSVTVLGLLLLVAMLLTQAAYRKKAAPIAVEPTPEQQAASMQAAMLEILTADTRYRQQHGLPPADAPPPSLYGGAALDKIKDGPLYREENAADRADAVNKQILHRNDPNPWLRALQDQR